MINDLLLNDFILKSKEVCPQPLLKWKKGSVRAEERGDPTVLTLALLQTSCIFFSKSPKALVPGPLVINVRISSIWQLKSFVKTAVEKVRLLFSTRKCPARQYFVQVWLDLSSSVTSS